MIHEEIEEVAQRISALDGVVGVVLFGSYSRGEQDEGSDIDLLVIFENKEALRKNQGKAYQITAETPLLLPSSSPHPRGVQEIPSLQARFVGGKDAIRKALA